MRTAEAWLALAGLVLGGWLLWLLAPVLTPFLLAGVLAYIGDPAADRLEAAGIPRTGAVAIVFVTLLLLGLGVLVLLLPMLVRQVELLATRLPVYLDWLQQAARPWLEAHTGLELPPLDAEVVRQALRDHWQSAGGAAQILLGGLSRSGVALLGWTANLVLVPVVTFYLLRDWDAFMARLRELIPRRWEPQVTGLAAESDQMLGAFLRGQLSVMVGLGVVYTTGLWWVGLDLALLVGLLSGLVSFVPYLGFIVGLIAAGIAALVQFQAAEPLLGVFAVYLVGQLLEGMVLTPLLLGGQIGLHPVAVIFAVLAGGQLFGFLGVLLALPVAAVVAVLLRHVHERYLQSALYAAGEAEGD